MERDFKGIWIPKEIWLSTELTMLEKVILVEIDSLDNENHCTASNEYLAEFCNCSQSKISKAIKHLTDLGLIELLNFICISAAGIHPQRDRILYGGADPCGS